MDQEQTAALAKMNAPKGEVADRQAWEQREGEGDGDYGKFLVFMGLGPTRSLATAEAASTGKSKKAQPGGGWRKLAAQHDWARRAEQFDLMVSKKVAGDMIDKRQAFTEGYLKSLNHAVDMINSCFEDGDIEKFRKLAPRVMMMLGKGRIGDYVTAGQKGIFGEKHQVESVTVSFGFGDEEKKKTVDV